MSMVTANELLGKIQAIKKGQRDSRTGPTTHHKQTPFSGSKTGTYNNALPATPVDQLDQGMDRLNIGVDPYARQAPPTPERVPVPKDGYGGRFDERDQYGGPSSPPQHQQQPLPSTHREQVQQQPLPGSQGFGERPSHQRQHSRPAPPPFQDVPAPSQPQVRQTQQAWDQSQPVIPDNYAGVVRFIFFFI